MVEDIHSALPEEEFFKDAPSRVAEGLGEGP